MPTIRQLKVSPGVRTGLAVALAVGTYGLSFGALSTAAGLSVLETCVLSVLMFTGGSQFAFIGVIAGGGSPAAALGAASLLGVRNAVYGVQMNALLRPRRALTRLGLAHLTIDESTAVALGQSSRVESRRGFVAAGTGIFVLWNGFTLTGALIGEQLGDPLVWGLDGAAVAAFLGLLWPRLKGREPWAIAVASAVVTVVLLPLAPQGTPIVVAAVVAIATALIFGIGKSADGDESPVTSAPDDRGNSRKEAPCN